MAAIISASVFRFSFTAINTVFSRSHFFFASVSPIDITPKICYSVDKGAARDVWRSARSLTCGVG